MTTHNGTVNNGTATITINTTNYQEGTYTITAEYKQNNTYQSSTNTATLTIEQGTKTVTSVYGNASLTPFGVTFSVNCYDSHGTEIAHINETFEENTTKTYNLNGINQFTLYFNCSARHNENAVSLVQ